MVAEIDNCRNMQGLIYTIFCFCDIWKLQMQYLHLRNQQIVIVQSRTTWSVTVDLALCTRCGHWSSRTFNLLNRAWFQGDCPALFCWSIQNGVCLPLPELGASNLWHFRSYKAFTPHIVFIIIIIKKNYYIYL